MTVAAAGRRTPATAVAAQALFRVSPHVILSCYLLLLALPQNNVLAGGGGGITPARVVAGGCLLWWLVARFAGGFKLAVGPNPVRRVMLLALGLFAAADAVAFIVGVPDSRISNADRGAMLFTLAVGAGLLVCDGLSSTRALRAVLAGAVVGFTCSAVAAILQFGTSLDLRKLTVFPGLALQPLGDLALSRGGLERSIGFAGHPIELAATSVAMLPLALHLARYGRFKLFWWACAVLLIGGPLVSISRTGLLGIAVVGLFLLPRYGLVRWLLVGGLLSSVVLAAGVIYPKLIDVLIATVAGSSKDSSIWSRLTKYDYVWAHFLAKPIGGQGLGTYVAPIQPYLDNQYLLTTVESGLPGLVGFVLLLGVPLWWTFRTWRSKKIDSPPQVRDAAWAIAVSLLVCALSFGTYDGLTFPQFAGVSVLLVGCAGALYRIAHRTEVSG
ncbi:O-antigen ligase family protein [Kutzneria kofuensis]|uniref:O-antigen ligase n=1 Tax=Kutzneria kofuensis TaxID=103725 RepID=A0A7W9KI89_9PSEU|nr:O-antigen ligase family protein [Kutzneria kofuensis]MBB5893021.1 O-antigen ligase [Kutzneria kofuensis]